MLSDQDKKSQTHREMRARFDIEHPDVEPTEHEMDWLSLSSADEDAQRREERDLAISLLDVAEKALESLIPLAENGGTFGQMCNSCRRNSYEFGVHSADCDVVKAKAVLARLREARDQQSK